jgi:hypothetical protein
MGMDIAYAPVKCYRHWFFGSLGTHCPACQDERVPPIRQTDVIEPPTEWSQSERGPK